MNVKQHHDSALNERHNANNITLLYQVGANRQAWQESQRGSCSSLPSLHNESRKLRHKDPGQQIKET